MAKDCKNPTNFKDRKLMNAEGLEMISGNESRPTVLSTQ